MVAAFPAVMVSGARQVGKTTLVRHLFPDFDYFIFDSTIETEAARKDPDLFLQNHPSPLILDDIQNAPEVAAALKSRIDANGARAGQYVIVTSEALKVLAYLWGSPVLVLSLTGYTIQENRGRTSEEGWLQRWLEDPVNLVRSNSQASDQTLWNWMWRGFIPGAQGLPEDQVSQFWSQYQRTYIEQSAPNLSDRHQFGLFWRLIGALTAQELNYRRLGSEVGITRETARQWRQILSFSSQWTIVPAFFGYGGKRVSTKPKGYLNDTGLACNLAQLPTSKSLGGHPMTNALFETAMYHEIAQQDGCLVGTGSFYHWRTIAGAKVDIVLERFETAYPFVVKMASNPGRKDCSGLTAFRQSCSPYLKIGKGAILCAAERPYWITEDVAAIPWNIA